jgi:hypothetical protein
MQLVIPLLHCISLWMAPPFCGAFHYTSISNLESRGRRFVSTPAKLLSWCSFTPIISPSSHSISSQSSMTLLSMSVSPRTRPQNAKPIQGRKRVRSVYLKHERDFFRQVARLESMDSYVLVSTLTASMSFGALLGFKSAAEATVLTAGNTLRAFGYKILSSTIPIVAGFSAIFGLYATIMFSLTILYGKSMQILTILF